MPHKFVVVTLGSRGDLNPLLRLATALEGHGHAVTVASSSTWRQTVSEAGVAFAAIPPAFPDIHELPEFLKRLAGTSEAPGIEDIATKVEPALHKLLAAAAPDQYAALRDIVDTDAVVVINMGVPPYGAFAFVEHRGVRWVNVVLEPGLLDAARGSSPRGPGEATAADLDEVASYRRGLGLPDAVRPWADLNLGLFSAVLARPRPDWPPTVVTGFAYDETPSTLGDDLDAFLHGDPALVFTLGSADVFAAGDFFDVSAEAARKLGQRAVCIGAAPTDGPSPDVLRVPAARYSEVFPRAAVVVHQGGIGTLGEGLRSGNPMLVVPARADQFDNASRAVGLGVARAMPRAQYTAATAAAEIHLILDSPHYSERARQVREYVMTEPGLSSAVEHLEAFAARSI
jgi:UDP:flavonoid glycosyltransferase YjiC (YdhE family)